jgi:putative PIN family toxin of toxin-antitoxin system
MVKIVLDTNIVISAALSPQGNPAKIIRLIRDREDIKLYFNTVILAEYEKVLSYKRLNIPEEEQKKALAAMQEAGEIVEPIKSNILMPDESDRIFYDTAQASGAILITGNIKHFPTASNIMTPADFLKKCHL